MPGVSNYFDLNEQFYLLTASGSVSSSGNINIHFKSDTLAEFFRSGSVQTKETEPKPKYLI